jgi:hypothetical protein
VITGARAPSALDLARRFHEAGSEVVVADSQPMLAARSRAVTAAYRVPPPRHRPREFARAVSQIAERHGAHLIVPTCEETFWLAAVSAEATDDALSSALFAPAPAVLRRLHDKAEFAALLTELGVAHPATQVVSSSIAWRHLARRRGADAPGVVVKPAFSRFGSRTIMVERGEPLPGLDHVGRVTEEERWLVQERLHGTELCTYAVAVDGRLTAFVVYEPVWRAGHGAGVAFERVPVTDARATAARDAAERIAAAVALTGQFGLDLIDTASGLSVIECNPRATSGVHLFAPGDGLATAFDRGGSGGRGGGGAGAGGASEAASVIEASRASARLGVPHLLYGPPGVLRGGAAAAGRFTRQFLHPDVLAERGDPIPLGVLARSLATQLSVARAERVPLLAAPTHDLEWNGEPLPHRAPRSHDESPGSRRTAGESAPSSTPWRRTARFACDPRGAETRTRHPGWADDFVEGLAGPDGTREFVENVGVDLDVVTIGGERVPLTVSTRSTTPPGREPESYVVSPLSHFVHYAREELRELPSPVARQTGSALLRGLDTVLSPARLDDVVIVGNALLSTNLLPDPGEGDVEALTRDLRARFPSHAIAWRSVHGRGSSLPATLRRAGYRLIPARSVLFTSTRDGEWLSLRDNRRDAALLDGSGYRAIDAPIAGATGMSPLPVRQRIARLYEQLYIERYSRLNPRYTAGFIGLAQRSGLLRFTLLEQSDPPHRIDGVLGTTMAHGYLAAPVLGYDTTLPKERGLYRMLTHLMTRTAHEHGVDLHGSSGVAGFKRNRGAEAEFEYLAVYARHLPFLRRTAWGALEAVVTTIAVPLVRRYGL